MNVEDAIQAIQAGLPVDQAVAALLDEGLGDMLRKASVVTRRAAGRASKRLGTMGKVGLVGAALSTAASAGAGAEFQHRAHKGFFGTPSSANPYTWAARSKIRKSNLETIRDLKKAEPKLADQEAEAEREAKKWPWQSLGK